MRLAQTGDQRHVVYRPLRGISTTIGIAAAFRRNEAGTPIKSFLECCAGYAKVHARG